MNPEQQFCHNSGCPAAGKVGADNIGVFSHQDGHYICNERGETFSETKDTVKSRSVCR